MGTTEVPPLIFKNFLACPVYAVWVILRSTWCPKRMRKRTTLMKFMKEIAYDGVEILDNDNVGKGVEEYSVADIDGIREDWSTYAVTSIFK
ncbi:hypothetical protein HanPI659440_Chr03g0115971 [Helianthus annuus]|nr:hypothetical protein HanPI659440_Chr03g0115971 [Helianthus annuus]